MSEQKRRAVRGVGAEEEGCRRGGMDCQKSAQKRKGIQGFGTKKRNFQGTSRRGDWVSSILSNGWNKTDLQGIIVKEGSIFRVLVNKLDL